MNQLKKRTPAKASAGKAGYAGKPKQKRKSREELNAEGRERKRQKKHRGNPSGSRHQDENSAKKQRGGKKELDPRVGSKVPVPLIAGTKADIKTVTETPKTMQAPRLSPKEELEMLENDDRLDELLARVEQGEKLSKEENLYVDTMLDRIDALMEELGIELTDEDSEEEEKKEDIMQLLKGK
ncbi:MAG: Der GTPase-activating protein YihI [Enterobacteriaceae bacterium]|jgi:ribosome assembly protein YihI (activator of Der GTPase)|nr:Der GTPase-activating protein YihI [Enterobacteriaceae bacterium]